LAGSVKVTKRRGKVFGAAQLKRLEEIFRSVCTDFEVILKEFNGGSDHVHLLVNDPPKVRLSELVNSLKGVSSRRMKREFPAISTFWSVRESKGHLWSPNQ
jgi:putative transposase